MNTASPVLPDISRHEAWFAAYAARDHLLRCLDTVPTTEAPDACLS